MTYVFVYGTLKRGYGNHGVLGRSLYIDEAITNSREFTMYDGGFPYVSDNFPNDAEAGAILGELYEVESDAVLANLDRLEGVPSLYVRREVDVTTLNNIAYKAFIYVASRGTNERLKSLIPMQPSGKIKVLEWKRVK